MVDEELEYDVDDETAKANDMYARMNKGQKHLFDAVLDSVRDAEHCGFSTHHMIFADAPGGTGKTFVLDAICSKIRAQKKIVLAVASSGIAAQLLTGGRTAHFKFQIPLKITAQSSCFITNQSNDPRAQLIKRTSLIIIDEGSMLHKHCYEAIDRTLQDVTDRDGVYFCGIPVVFSGDFRQILPVVRQGSRFQTMEASLQRSKLWSHINVIHLTENMRIWMRRERSREGQKVLKDYGEFLLRVGEGVKKHILREETK